MQTSEKLQEQEFVASFALQRQRLLHHAGSIVGSADSPGDPALAQLSQTLATSLELLKVAEEVLREEQRTSATRSLVQDRRIMHLSALFDLAPTPLVLTGTDTTIREANKAAASFLGWDPESLSGRRLLDMVCATHRTGFREQLAHAVEIGSVAAWSFRVDLHRAPPIVVVAAVSLISDAAIGTRALYWSLRPA